MSYLRFTIDLAVKEPIPSELKEELPSILKTIKKLKSFASKINEGKENEEFTIKATFHRCYHDEGKPCEPEQEI